MVPEKKISQLSNIATEYLNEKLLSYQFQLW